MYKADSNKVVYNACYGGFSLSKKAIQRLVELGAHEMLNEIKEHDEVFQDFKYLGDNYRCNLSRHDNRLVQVVEELKEESGGSGAKLEIATILSNKYIIEEYDGMESVVEPNDLDWIEI